MRRSNKHEANALAAGQDSVAPHLSRQACSTLLRKTNGSALDLASVNWLMKDGVSSENLPPTSPGRPRFPFFVLLHRGHPHRWTVLLGAQVRRSGGSPVWCRQQVAIHQTRGVNQHFQSPAVNSLRKECNMTCVVTPLPLCKLELVLATFSI